jgi:hypothetical protein
MRRKAVAAFSFFLFALIGLASCGGGGGSDPIAGPAAAAAPPPVDSTGVVGILIKDNPTGDFLRIMITITGVELLGEDGAYVVFSGEKTFDLLDLQNFYDMLAVSDKVPAGTYDKIRLRVSDITVVCDDGAGGEEEFPVEVPGGGKIDLNPQGDFFVSAGSGILIEIDIDAKKSIHIVQNGNQDIYRFRPVVLVEIRETQLTNALVRVHGDIGVGSKDETGFDLCNVAVQFQTDTNGCIPINVIPDDMDGSEYTRFFDENGDPVDFEDLIEGEFVTVYGIPLVATDPDDGDSDSEGDSDGDSDGTDDSDSDGDSDSDSDSDFDNDTVRLIQIDAIVVQRDPDNSAARYDGTVITAVDESTNEFQFAIDPGQGLTGDLLVATLVQNGTTILFSDLSLGDSDDIQPALEASIGGVVELSDSGPNRIKSMLIVLRDPDDDQEQISGVIENMSEDGVPETFDLVMDSEQTPVCPVAGARYFYQMPNDEGGTDISEISFDELRSLAPADGTVFGTSEDDGDDCFDATLVYAIQLASEI